MAVQSPSRCTAHQLSRSLRPRWPHAFRNRSVSGPGLFSEPPAPRLVSVRSQTPGPDMFGSRPSTSFHDSEPSIVSPTTSSAIEFLTLCRHLKTKKAIVGDITPSDGVPKEEKSRRERTALNEMCEVLGGGMRAEEIKELWEEYENNSSVEANLVKDFDKVEMILQALEYENGIIMGKCQTEIGKTWAAEISSRRKSRL